jgi:hypothetical protein
MIVKAVSSADVRAKWAAIQADTVAGQMLIVRRHDLTTTVMMPPEWEGVGHSKVWQDALLLLRQKHPDKTDYWLITEVLQKFAWDQDSGSSKNAKLDRIYTVLLWVARKLGYEE